MQKAAAKASETFNISYDWIPGHRDHTGNEFADYLAKEGSRLPTQGPLPILPISYANAKRRIVEYIDRRWDEEWCGYSEAAQTKFFLPHVSREGRKLMTAFTRGDLSLICRIITGHGPWRYSLSKGTQISPICTLCSTEEEKPIHLLVECPALTLERQNLSLRLSRYDKGPNFTQRYFELVKIFRSKQIQTIIDLNRNDLELELEMMQ